MGVRWRLDGDVFTFYKINDDYVDGEYVSGGIAFTWEIQYIDKLKDWYKKQPRDEDGFLIDQGEAIYKGLNSCSSDMRDEWLFVLENELTLIEFDYEGYSDGMAVELNSSKDFSKANGFYDYLDLSEWV